jgi:hypothetical protein
MVSEVEMPVDAWILLAALGLTQHSPSQHHGPYAGLQSRELKALGDEEIRGLTEGEGMSMALVAELNHYPGPRHVLELADALELSGAQRAAARESFGRMKAEAVRLGGEILARERELEALFREGGATEAAATLVVEVGRLRGELRWAHLRAHLEMRAALSSEQRERYDRLRGYSGAAPEE